MTARRCSAQLSWRLPPRSRRWRSVRPEEAGIGADAGGAGELGVGGEALDAGDLADQLGGGQHAAAALGQQPRRELGDQRRRARARARRSRGSARGCGAARRARSAPAWSARRAPGGRRPAPASTRGSARAAGSRAPGQRSCRPQRRSLISAVRCATSRSRWSTSSRTSSSGPASCATGSVSSPSRIAARAIATASIAIGLAALARATCARRPSASAPPARPARPRASRKRSSAPGHVPAVLDRPHPLAVERRAPTAAGPRTTAACARTVRSAATRPVAGIDRRQRVRDLVRVRPDHDHPHRPFVGIPDERIAGGHISVGAMPRSYQVTPAILGRRRATQPTAGQTHRPTDRLTESARRRPRTYRPASDATARHDALSH